MKSVHQITSRLVKWPFFLAILLGFASAWIFKESITGLVFPIAVYAESSLFIRSAAFLLGCICFFSVYLACFVFIPKLIRRFPKSKPLNTIIELPVSTRLNVFLAILALGLMVIFFVNNVYPHIDTTTWTYANPKIIPTMDPVGNDFRVGLYQPPQLLLSGEKIYVYKEGFASPTQYPPLLNFLYLPFQLFSEDQAYLLHIIFLFCINLICLGMATKMVRDIILPLAGFDQQTNTLIGFFLFIGIAFFTITGYPFLFSIERGNYDIVALFFAMLAINSLLRKPNQLWIQVILLSIAVHLKIYPAALFIILLTKHGKKLILPALIVNLAFLLVLGPQNAITFMKILGINGSMGFTWVGNHSGFSFATYLSWVYSAIAGNIVIFRNLFTVIPVILWSCSIFRVIKQKLSELNILVMLMVSLPLMDVLPPISHDYKSVILGPTLIILIAILLVKVIRHSNFWEFFQLILVMVIMLFLGRSFALNQESLILINNKYILILGLALLTLINSVIPANDHTKVIAA